MRTQIMPDGEGPCLTGRTEELPFRIVTTETEILAAVDAMSAGRKARLMPKLRRRLEDYYDLQAVKRAQAKGVYHAYAGVRRQPAARHAKG